MPPTKSPILTEAELRLMDVLWERGPCSVQQVLLALPTKPRLAYNSVLTTMRILEKKGYVEHVKDGRAHIYAPTIRREDATKSEISHLLNRFFQNSRELLLLNILDDASLDRNEVDRLRRLIAKSSTTGEAE